MPHKSKDQLSPAYRRRIENAERKGKSRQQARGHKAREHVTRAERETEERGITRAQENIISNWYARNYNPAGYPGTARADEDDILEMTKSEGYAVFVRWRKVWDAARREYLKELDDGSYASRGEQYLQFLAIEAGRDELSWLYYH